MYNGKIKVDFNEKTHRYKVNGVYVKSVTTILNVVNKPALIYWAVGLSKNYLLDTIKTRAITEEDILEASNLHKKKKEEAAKTGTLVHKWAEQYIKSKIDGAVEPEIPEEEKVKNGVVAFLEWVSFNKIEFMASEVFVYSLKHNYIGIADCIAVVNGKETLVDFKTSNGIYDEMRYQVAAYRNAYNEENGEKIEKSIIAKFDKETAEFTTIELDDHKKDLKAFLACQILVKRANDIKEYNKLKKQL